MSLANNRPFTGQLFTHSTIAQKSLADTTVCSANIVLRDLTTLFMFEGWHYLVVFITTFFSGYSSNTWFEASVGPCLTLLSLCLRIFFDFRNFCLKFECCRSWKHKNEQRFSYSRYSNQNYKSLFHKVTWGKY